MGPLCQKEVRGWLASHKYHKLLSFWDRQGRGTNDLSQCPLNASSCPFAAELQGLWKGSEEVPHRWATVFGKCWLVKHTEEKVSVHFSQWQQSQLVCHSCRVELSLVVFRICTWLQACSEVWEALTIIITLICLSILPDTSPIPRHVIRSKY